MSTFTYERPRPWHAIAALAAAICFGMATGSWMIGFGTLFALAANSP